MVYDLKVAWSSLSTLAQAGYGYDYYSSYVPAWIDYRARAYLFTIKSEKVIYLNVN